MTSSTTAGGWVELCKALCLRTRDLLMRRFFVGWGDNLAGLAALALEWIE